MNTVKRYARAATADVLQRPPRYRETLVDPFRDHLRRRRTEDPKVAVTRLLDELREHDYTGTAEACRPRMGGRRRVMTWWIGVRWWVRAERGGGW